MPDVAPVTARDHADRPFPPLDTELGTVLGRVPRSARWVLPTFAAAFRGALVLLRVASIDRSPYWREQHERSAVALGIDPDELALISADEWETAPAFSDRERAAILWADRTARRLARRDAGAYRKVRAQLSEAELVELTTVVALACMATRFTNALRIVPEPPNGLSPAGLPVDDALARWSTEMFDALPGEGRGADDG